jgi:hypothetical protein
MNLFLFLSILVFTFLSSSAFAHIDHPEKIGIGTWEVDSYDTSLKNVEAFNFGWYYDWRTTHLYSNNPNSSRTVPFIPMFWNAATTSESIPSNATELLGFNEPDRVTQSNMTVDQAITLWPKLMATGLRLGSPAMAGNAIPSTSWLGQFMSKASAKNYPVDFIAIHYYSEDGNVATFKSYLEQVYATYKKPIWVTEWAMVDWNDPSKNTFEQNAIFAQASLEMLDDLAFVERHAWFSAIDDGEGLNTELLDSNNNLTVVGKIFQQALAGTLAPLPQEPIPTGSNLITNGGFENGLNSWSSWGGNSILDASIKSSGSYSVRAGTGDSGMGKDVINKLTVGKNYRLQAMAKLSAATTDQAWVGIKFYNAAGESVGSSSRLVYSTSFQNYSLDFTLPLGATKAYVYFWKNAGTAYEYVDEFSIFELSVPTSPTPDPTPTPIKDIIAPTATLSFPTQDTHLPRRSTVTLTALATDNVGVTKVIFLVNGSQVCSTTTAPYKCSYKTPKQSSRKTIQVKALDAAGNIGYSSLVTVYID